MINHNPMSQDVQNRLLSYELTVINASFEDYAFPIYGRYFDFPGRSKVTIPEFTATGDPFEWPIDNEHATKGLFVLRPGDDYKAKELKALSMYLLQLDLRITNYNKKIDEMKAAGKHIRELPKKLQQAMDWSDQIRDLLKMNKMDEVSKSFIEDYKPIVGDVDFKSTPEVQEVKLTKSNRKSFKDLEANV